MKYVTLGNPAKEKRGFRKLVIIDLSRLSSHKSSLIKEAQKLSYAGQVEWTQYKMTGNTTAMKKIIPIALKEYEKDSIELFGKPNYTTEEIADRKYLKSLIK